MAIKKGDKVMVLAGKDRGKQSKVVRVLPRRKRVWVEGVNLVKKRERPRRAGEKGQIVTRVAPIHLSNIALFCGRCGRGVRHGFKFIGKDKVRICRSCGVEL